jgi:type IV pilus assembly protein PilB
MKEQIGLNFAATLRSFLRQDPNIVLVGEIRDFETAEIAIKAALTGHLVLSTLHTNDAPSTINRLMNMGIEPFLVATSVQSDRRAEARAPDLRELQGRGGGDPQALLNLGFKKEEIGTFKVMKGRGLRKVQQSRATRAASA